MRVRSWLICVGLMVACLFVVPVLAQGAESHGAATESGAKPVTLDLTGVPLDVAIVKLLAATDLSVVIAGPVPKEPMVQVRVSDCDPVSVLKMLAVAGGLLFDEWRPEGGNGRGVVLLAPQQVAQMPMRGAPQPAPAKEPSPVAPQASQGLPSLNFTSVDLNLKEVPFREAVAAIAKQLPAEDQKRIVVDEAVPKDLRVTARVRKMSGVAALSSIVEQAGLTYALQAHAMRDYAEGETPPRPDLVIVPRPEIHVTGGGERRSP